MSPMRDPRWSLVVNLSSDEDRADTVSLEKPRCLELTEQNAEEKELHKERTLAICRGSSLGPQCNKCTSVRKMLEDRVRTTQKEQREPILELIKAGNSSGSTSQNGKKKISSPMGY